MSRRHGKGIGAALAMLATTAACTVGAKLDRYPLAQGPWGVTASVSTRTGTMSGELLEVRPDAMLLLSQPRRLVLVGYAVIREASFAGVGERLKNGAAPGARQRERLRLVSRFPQGLSKELLSVLLRDSEQTEPETLQP